MLKSSYCMCLNVRNYWGRRWYSLENEFLMVKTFEHYFLKLFYTSQLYCCIWIGKEDHIVDTV